MGKIRKPQGIKLLDSPLRRVHKLPHSVDSWPSVVLT